MVDRQEYVFDGGHGHLIQASKSNIGRNEIVIGFGAQ